MQTIIYIIPALIKSGPVNVLYNIIKNLNRKEFKPIIIALYEHPLRHRDNTNSFKELETEVHVYNYTKWELQLKTSQIANNIQKKFETDKNVIFHAHGYYPTLILSKMKNAKTMTTIHNRCSEDFNDRYGLFLGSLMSYFYKLALKKLNLCVPICDTMKQYYAKDKKLNLEVINNGVNIGNCYVDNHLEKEKLGITNKTKVLLYPATFSKLKNQQFIIQELKTIESNDFIVLFAGMGEEEEYCKSLVEDDSRFRFLGYQMDMEKYWAVSDFMISSSYSEGLPMAVLEALTRGLPCILSDIPSHQEILMSIFGNTELCFNLNQKGQLKDLFVNKINVSYDKLDIQNKAIQLYSSDVMAKKYEKMYSLL